MRNWSNIYTQSIRKLLTSISGLITIGIYVFIVVYIVLIMPLTELYTHSIGTGSVNAIQEAIYFGMFALSIFVFTMLASFMYKMEEMCFILARPVSRKDWITAKLCAMGTVIFCLSLFNEILWLILNGVITSTDFGLISVFNHAFLWWMPFVMYFIFGLFCATLVILLQPYMSISLIMIIALMITALSMAPFLAVNLIKASIHNWSNSTQRNIWFNGMFTLPFCIALIVGGGCFSLTFWQIDNWKVEI